MKIIFFVCRVILRLRYRVSIKGLDAFSEAVLNSPKGILFLPNHPSLMDPFILFAWLWPRFQMRPLTVEFIYRIPILRPFANRLGALSMPGFYYSYNQVKVRKAKKVLESISEGLKKGGRFLIAPAGQIKGTEQEMLGGVSAAFNVIRECPDVQIALIRTTGLWGSSFSRAQTGQSPDLLEKVGEGIKIALKNFIFFMPRREVLIEIKLNPIDFPHKGTKIEMNQYLERWYNGSPDTLKLVPYYFWSQAVPKIKISDEGEKQRNIVIPEENRLKVYSEIRRILDNPHLEIRPEMTFAYDLGMDSLNIGDLSAFLLHHFDAENLSPENLVTVQNALEFAKGERPKNSASSQSAFCWPEELNRPLPTSPEGKNFPEAFLLVAKRMKKFAAYGDDFSGVFTYQKIKKIAIVLAEVFKKIPEREIGILLPASAGAFITLLALQLAGKIPVLLNWTLGPRYLEEMMKQSGAKKIFTSWKFLDKVSHIDFGQLVDQIEVLEDLKDELTLGQKLKGYLISKLPTRMILSILDLISIDPKSPCAILFTSGTESAPKGVPVSHQNLLENIRASFEVFDKHLNPSDCFYAFLPPFHVSGFTVTGFIPLLIGVKAACYPNPTDQAALVNGIDRWKITMVVAPPSFLSRILAGGSYEQFKSIRVLMTGVEKAPEKLLRQIHNLFSDKVKYLEGYGITECSGPVSLNRLDLPLEGVGPPLSGYEILTIHPETQQPLPEGEEGELCVRGPSVFYGYLGGIRSPFIEIYGKNWYRTGDLGRWKKGESIYLTGRLKRFTKIGGEMISLGAVEEAITSELLNLGLIPIDSPSAAVCADETVPGEVKLVLFSTISIEREEANQILRKKGFSNLIKIAHVRKINEIPLLGTGKIDYRNLQRQQETAHELELKNG